MQKDVNWWLEYIRTFNGVNFIINPATTAFTYKGDACLDGGGGFHGEELEQTPSTLDAWRGLSSYPPERVLGVIGVSQAMGPSLVWLLSGALCG